MEQYRRAMMRGKHRSIRKHCSPELRIKMIANYPEILALPLIQVIWTSDKRLRQHGDKGTEICTAPAGETK